MAIKLNQKDIIKLSNNYHNFRYDYTNTVYLNRRTDIEVYCSTHKCTFKVNPRNHYEYGVRCSYCFEEDKLKDHLLNANKKHSYSYDYSLVPLGVRARDKVDIICKVHGVFKQNFGNHLHGQGCPTCRLFFWGWSLEKFSNKCQHNLSNGIFYILKCTDSKESFYKLGITSKSIEARYNSKSLMPYSFEVIQEINDTPENIWRFELMLKEFIKKSNIHYTPSKKFGGSLTECFLI